MGKTKIAWTQEVWNPVVGCSKVSAGCANCYAERMDKRIRGARGEDFKLWTPQNAAYNVRLHPERLEEPLHWKKPRMVFVNSMSDLFHGSVPFDFIKRVFETMNDERARKHTFQILTKRPERMANALASIAVNGLRLSEYPLSNVWLGVSVENQRAADERIPLLLQTPAAVRFLSCEPLLSMVNLAEWLFPVTDSGGVTPWGDSISIPDPYGSQIDWVIVGGESGPNYRPMDLDWARSIRDQCVAADVPFFFKQGAGHRPGQNDLLDGREWKEFPKVSEQ